MLDHLFGENNFVTEIVWRRTNAKSQTFNAFPNNHDTIFFYGGGGERTFNRQFIPHSEEYIERFYKQIEPETGRRYMADNITAPEVRNGASGETWRGINISAKGLHWKYTVDKLEQFEKQGRILWPKKVGGMPRFKRYLDEMKGVAVDSIWSDIPPIQAHADERLGYPTQKPLSLLERIIKASSNANDIVLDAFCGCGTALVAAQNLGRQWIGIDISPTACRVMAKRMRDICKLPENENLWRVGRGFVVRDLPWTVEKLKQIPPFEFENWAVIALGGIPNKVQVGDMGVDGRIYPVGTKPRDADSGGLFADDWFPIQVKQSDKVGRPDIDAFEAVMEREGKGGRQRGFFVAFGYTSDAERECNAFYKRTGRVIKLLTVQEILDEEHVQKM
jgi:hypothetical protein